ncbi:MAG: arginase family protein, partial [Gemmatimonadota bacterium]
MRVRLIEVPYHAGQLRTGMGRGPERILEGGAAERLRERGADVTVESVEIAAGSWNEVGATFELNRALRGRVRAALEDGVFPLVLSGNCSSSHGTLAALGG